jgi:hypothetical protein
VVEIDADDARSKAESMIASGLSDGNSRMHVNLGKWEGYSHDKNTWEL